MDGLVDGRSAPSSYSPRHPNDKQPGFSPDHTWFAATFMAAAALTVLNSLLTFLGGRLKRKPLMQVRKRSLVAALDPAAPHSRTPSIDRPPL